MEQQSSIRFAVFRHGFLIYTPTSWTASRYSQNTEELIRCEHRDANAAFNIGQRGLLMLSGSVLSVALSGIIGDAQAEKEVAHVA
jgi:transposase